LEEYQIVFTKRGKKDFNKVMSSSYNKKAIELLNIISLDPYEVPPEYKVLVGEMNGLISRRISIKHRLVYMVMEKEKVVKVLMVWTHYHE